MNNPLVTIYIPTYNRKELLSRAVNSVLNQTYKNIEVIIVDDCSPDDTIEYLEELIRKDNRVRYFQNETNSGACVSRNKAIKEAKGEFITGLDDDDYFLPSRIENFVNYWQKHVKENSDVVCLFSSNYVKNTDSYDINKMKISKKFIKIRQFDLLIGNFIGNQVFTTTEELRNNLFDENLPMWQDLDCWYRLLKNNQKAIKIKVPSYVMDVSHPHERITIQKSNKVFSTFQYLSNKYKLNNKQKTLLQTHTFSYNVDSLNFKIILKLFYQHKNILSFILLLKKNLNKKFDK
ncbi:hypothetical protein CRU94_04540 [Arcobacter sp. AHV-9/2010]|uniref:glycosyltransferase n=1 Tax=Arcobacter sp. AHV-9/2010 TaxID=2021861 RepID=UPI00100ADF6C|nr:glycosyltransferase [Arcobacter sp. CECT 9299]RXJ95885.1 hypothetical protein CRU94_04540 [Arcobacter sp. CECT 9299]